MNMLIMSVIKHQTIIKCDSVQNTILFSLGLDSSGGGAVHMHQSGEFESCFSPPFSLSLIES